MISRISSKIAFFFVSNRIIEKDKEEIYSYGLELLISQMISILSVLLIGALIGHFVDVLVFLIVFIPLRTYAGGYHAESHIRCLIALVANVAVVIIINTLIAAQHIFALCLALFIPSLIFLLAIAPAEHINKPLEPYERKRNKRISVAIFCMEEILSVMCFMLFEKTVVGTTISLGMYSAVASMAVAYIISNKGGENYEKQNYEDL